MANRGTSKFHYSASCIQNSFARCTQGYLYGVSRRCVIQVTLPPADTCTEFSSGMYSPEVFTIAQLLGELPYCILCAIVYWIIMVIGSNTFTLPLSTQNVDLRARVRSRLSWAGRNRVATGGHHFCGIFRRVIGTTCRSNYALGPSGYLVRPVYHGHFDYFLFVYFRPLH
jgi:hypothetical protein